MPKKTWLDLKVGDEVIVVLLIGEPRETFRDAVVNKVGRKYITVQYGRMAERFSVESGYGEYGYSLHTHESRDDYYTRRDALRIITNGMHGHSIATEDLVAFAKKMKEANDG